MCSSHEENCDFHRQTSGAPNVGADASYRTSPPISRERQAPWSPTCSMLYARNRFFFSAPLYNSTFKQGYFVRAHWTPLKGNLIIADSC